MSLLADLCSCSSWPSHLRRPPPPREPREPMLELPRELLARAELPLPPPKALALDRGLELGETLRLPTRSPPPADEERFAPLELRSLARGCSPRDETSRVLPCALFPCCEIFWRALAWRLAAESPRVVPPYF